MGEQYNNNMSTSEMNNTTIKTAEEERNLELEKFAQDVAETVVTNMEKHGTLPGALASTTNQVEQHEDGKTKNINGMFKAKPIQTSQMRKEKKLDEEHWKLQKTFEENEERKKAEELERIQRNEELKRQRKEEQKRKN